MHSATDIQTNLASPASHTVVIQQSCILDSDVTAGNNSKCPQIIYIALHG